MKYILNVPFSRKDSAKDLGARWDPVIKKWFYEGEELPSGLEIWYPDTEGMRHRIQSFSSFAKKEKEAADPDTDPYASYLTVSMLNQRIAGEYSGNPLFRQILVKGEVTNYSGHKRNYYFSIKDAYAELSCVLWEATASSMLKFELQNGQSVAIRGTLEYYEQRGVSQLVVREIENIGEGLQKLALMKLRAKLEAEGMFDPAHKKPLPKHARSIGIVTSDKGQAFRDICKIAKKRCPSIQLVLYPVNVQGDLAAKTTVAGIRALDAYGVDVIIVGRGGGSDEDLMAYNDERIVRAIYAAKTPIISAVGHAGNHSFTDDAADFFAATPSEAAETAAADTAAVIMQVESLSRELQANMSRILLDRQHRVSRLSDALGSALQQNIDARRQQLMLSLGSLHANHPAERLKQRREKLNLVLERLTGSMNQAFDLRKRHFEVALAGLHGLSPTSKLVNGFGYISIAGKPLIRVSDAQPGEELSVRMHDGEITSLITGIHTEDT